MRICLSQRERMENILLKINFGNFGNDNDPNHITE